MHYLLRHGETNFNEKGLVQGYSNDSRLTINGRKEMQWAAKWLDSQVDCFDEVICSDLYRAHESWIIIRNHIKFMKFRFTQALREQGQGIFEGMPYDDPKWIAFQKAQKKREAPPLRGTENIDAFNTRISEFFDGLIPSIRSLIISHGGVLECHLKQLGIKNPRVANGEIICIDRGQGNIEKPTIHHVKPNS
jgi:broad specificity phosphatase PhoE